MLRPIHWLILFVLSTGLVVQAQEPTPLPLYSLPGSRTPVYTSGTLALTVDGRTLVASNMLNNTLSFIDVIVPTAAQFELELSVGLDPRSVALTPDSSLVVVSLRGENRLAVVDVQAQTLQTTIDLGGALPYGVVSDSNDRAFVALQGSNEVVEVSLIDNEVTRRIPVPDHPAGLAVWGDFLYVTHFWNGAISLIYIPRGEMVGTVPTGPDTGLSQALAIDVQRGLAYLPQTRSNAQNEHLTFDTTVFPIVNVIELSGMILQPRARIDLSTSDRPVNMPFAVEVDRFRNWLYVANAGSHDVSVIDLNTGLGRANIPVGANPRGLALNRDNTFIFVHNALDGTLSIVDTGRFVVVDVLPISNPVVSNDLIVGAELFYSSADPRLSEDRWLSCATCHFDGQSDGRVWQGFPDGPRNTPVLYNLIETAPYNWSATWDELFDIEVKIRSLQVGSGLVEDFPVGEPLQTQHANLSFDLDLLEIYLRSLTPPFNPNQFDEQAIARGQTIFENQGCNVCHSGAAGTDLQSHDVGTGDASQENHGLLFDTPSLRYLWLSAPYFHDGSAPDLRAVFTMPGLHQLIKDVEMVDIEALIAYLLSWA